MNKKIFTVKTVLFLAVLFLISSQAFAGYSGGIGTQTRPFEISKSADWQFLMSAPSDWSKYFILTADLNLAGINVTPIGNSTNRFTGVFDGNDHIISNVTINLPNNDNVGLFGVIENAKISNLGIEDANITGKSSVGGLAGCCSSTASDSYCQITNCSIKGKVAGNSKVGGLIGFCLDQYSNSIAKIDYCYTSGTVTGSDSVGGLIGNVASNNLIIKCRSTCNAVGNSFVGGLIGTCSASIYYSYAAGNVSAFVDKAGGLVGDLYNSSSSIQNCFATGNVQSTLGFAGGLVGNKQGSILYSYSTGLVTADAYKGGGLIGYSSGSSTNCFWDTQSSGKTVAVGSGISTGVIGKTTSEMKTISTFANAGWEITDINGPDRLWTLPENDYPMISSLYWTTPVELTLSGDGSTQNPYQIWTNDDFVTLTNSGSIWNKNFILMDDLDLTGVFFRPIGNSIVRFTGTFDGQGFTISNAQMNFPQKDYVAIFGFAGKNANFKNLNIQDANITGGKYTAALVANNYDGRISNCSVNGTINTLVPASFAGGLAGFSSFGWISNCSSDVTINACGSTAGGLVGVNGKENEITNCFPAGQINDSDPNNIGACLGGLAGTNSFGIIMDCKSSVDVNSTSASQLSSINAGALTGTNYGEILKCFATGKVSVSSTSACLTAGGLVGANALGDVNDCHAAGDISFDPNCSDESAKFAGGLVGINYDAVVDRCYSRGLVGSVQANESDPNYCTAGGLAGFNVDGKIFRSFWDIQTSGKNISAGGRGLNSDQMKNISIYQLARWGTSILTGTWTINNNLDYPHLAWENMQGTAISQNTTLSYLGSGTQTDPYQIWTAADFASLSWDDSILNKYIVLMQDVNLAGVMIYPIGENTPFTGTFDGNGHTLKNVTLNHPTRSYVALFARIGSTAVIKNVRMENVTVVGNDYVAGLIAKNDGAIVTGCHLSGSIDGFYYVGGLIGENTAGSIIDCHVNAAVTAWDCMNSDSYAGGLVGKNSAPITNCSAKGSLSSACSYFSGPYTPIGIPESRVCAGGLVGHNSGTINTSFATNSVCLNSTSTCTVAGGFIGLNCGTINDCYSQGAVSSTAVPFSGDQVTSKVITGGFIGYNFTSSTNTSISGKIYRCYSSGSVLPVTSDSTAYIGGLIGNNNTSSICSYSMWDTENSGQPTSKAGSGKTTQQMKTMATFTFGRWDFSGETLNGTADIWRMPFGSSGYPMLYWQRDIIGDFGGKYGVGPDDFAALASAWYSQLGNDNFNPACDISQPADNIINELDLAILASNWLNGL